MVHIAGDNRQRDYNRIIDSLNDPRFEKGSPQKRELFRKLGELSQGKGFDRFQMLKDLEEKGIKPSELDRELQALIGYIDPGKQERGG